jgi:lipid-A-disaccharide synthase
MAAPTILLTGIEASGDALGAALMRALKARLGEVRFIGAGGAQMAAEGLHSVFDTRELSVLGILEAFVVWRRARDRARQVVELARREKPDVAVLIDAWGFSSMTGRMLKDAMPGLPLVKYVAPQLWATRPGRAKRLAAIFDHLLSILPFDAPYFEGLPIETTFVGHPVLAQDFSHLDGARLRTALGIAPDDQILLVLPGSRPAEIARVMPVFEQAVARLKAERPDLQVVVPLAGPVADQVRARVAAWPFRVHVVADEGLKRDAMKAATVALACSGTVTSELAMAGAPMVVGYRLSALTVALIRMIIRVRFATLFNIAADRAVAPEFIQEDLTADKLVDALNARLDDPELRARQVEEQYAALERLGRGGPNPAETAADVVAGIVRSGRREAPGVTAP